MPTRALVAAAVVVIALIGPVTDWARRAEQPGPAPTLSDVTYAPAAGADVMDLWLPAGAPRPYPLVIFVHGGGFSGGDKRDVGPTVLPLTRAGFAVASIDYRLSGQAHFPQPPRDVKAAVRYLRAHATDYAVDPSRFALWGESAGANLAALVGVTGARPTLFDDPSLGNAATSAAVQAVVDWYGPIDFAQRENQFRAGGSDCRAPQLAVADGFTTGYLGADVEHVPREAALADPITWVRGDGGLPPFLIGQGTADCLVPTVQARQLADALRAAGGQVDLHLLPGAVHADPRFDRELLAPTIGWLTDVLDARRVAAPTPLPGP